MPGRKMVAGDFSTHFTWMSTQHTHFVSCCWHPISFVAMCISHAPLLISAAFLQIGILTWPFPSSALHIWEAVILQATLPCPPYGWYIQASGFLLLMLCQRSPIHWVQTSVHACCLWVSGQPSSCQVWSILKGVPWGWIQTYKSKCHLLCLVQLDTLLVAMLVWAWPIWHSKMYSTYSTWGMPHHITGVLFVGSLLVFSRFSCAIRGPFVYCKRYNIKLVLPPLSYSWQLPKNTKITHQTNYHHILWPLLTNDIKPIRVVQHKWYNFKSANCMLCQCRDPILNFVVISFPIYVHIQKDYKEKWKHFLCFLLMVWRLYFWFCGIKDR